MSAGAASPAGAAISPVAQLRGARVLVVDDSDVIRDVTRSLLEDAGIIVEEAADGAAAVRLMRENPVRCHLILMDVQMPVLDGIAATRAICAEAGGQPPPIIAVTAHTSDAEKRACHDAGMCDHLRKPLDPVQLIDTLQRWLAPAARTGNAGQDAEDQPVVRAATPPVLPQVPGFDWTAGLHCVGGNAELLRAMLLRFGSRYAEVVAQLRERMAGQDYREARRIAHTLKGAAATLGGTAIAQSAAPVERLLLQWAEAADTGVTGPCAQLEASLAGLESALNQALPVMRAMAAESTSAHAPAAASSADLPQGDEAEYQALRQLLADNCYAARKAFATLRDRLGAGDAEWQAAAAAVDGLDFAQALARLDARYPAMARKS